MKTTSFCGKGDFVCECLVPIAKTARQRQAVGLLRAARGRGLALNPSVHRKVFLFLVVAAAWRNIRLAVGHVTRVVLARGQGAALVDGINAVGSSFVAPCSPAVCKSVGELLKVGPGKLGRAAAVSRAHHLEALGGDDRPANVGLDWVTGPVLDSHRVQLVRTVGGRSYRGEGVVERLAGGPSRGGNIYNRTFCA